MRWYVLFHNAGPFSAYCECSLRRQHCEGSLIILHKPTNNLTSTIYNQGQFLVTVNVQLFTSNSDMISLSWLKKKDPFKHLLFYYSKAKTQLLLNHNADWSFIHLIYAPLMYLCQNNFTKHSMVSTKSVNHCSGLIV